MEPWRGNCKLDFHSRMVVTILVVAYLMLALRIFSGNILTMMRNKVKRPTVPCEEFAAALGMKNVGMNSANHTRSFLGACRILVIVTATGVVSTDDWAGTNTSEL